MEKLGIRGLVTIGGDGSLSIAQQLFEGGVPLVGVPKTIDNDLEGTMMTFGFDSAVACATDALDRLHTTAESHNRVMVLEVMGRYAGWIALHAGVAGGGRRDPDSGDPLHLREHFRQDSGAGEGGQAFHPGGGRGRRREKGRRVRHRRRSARQPRSPAGRHRRRWSGRKSRNERARKAGCACWATCSAAAAPRTSIACFAPCSAPRRWN